MIEQVLIYSKNISTTNVSNHFALVLVSGIKTSDAIKSKIEDLPLETQPILIDNDLIYYKCKEHELELSKDFEFNESLRNVPVDGLPFVVIANDKRVYLGAFWTSLSADIPIINILPLMTDKNIIKIEPGYPVKM